MSTAIRNKGPWTHRLLVWGFTAALALLCFWLSGFVLNDIGTWPGPDFEALERSMLDQRLVHETKALARQIEETQRNIQRDTKRQQVLRDSTAEAQRTMGQLLDFQRLAIEKGVTPTAEEQKALADSQAIFLENQRRFQELNQQIARLEDQRDAQGQQQRGLEERLEKARRPVHEEFERQYEQHRWRLAAIKLAVLVPLLVAAAFMFLTWRTALHAPLVYAFGAAVVARTGLVMHEYFPTRWFKYILIGVALVAVLRTLVFLVRSIAFPKRDWLVRQYREAYERFLCPVCEYPIRRGPLKYLFWTRRTAKKLPQVAVPAADGEAPYTCPMCGTRLYEECPQCHALRHSLLPACEHCGTSKPLEDLAAMTRHIE